jgi:NADPH-dependent 2,4-dienoyl-CoA reductase/sulfur reductase-like enzyme
MAHSPHITVLGGGPAGLAAGAAARDLGLEAVVIEAEDRHSR